MKITREQFKTIVKEVMTEENEYQAFFQKALDKAGKSIPSMSDEEKKAFFDKIDAAWNGKGEKNEELVGGQKELDVDGDGDISGDDLADLRAGKKADESVNEDYDGPVLMKTGNKNTFKVGEKVTFNDNGKKREYKVIYSKGNGDFTLKLVESVNEIQYKDAIQKFNDELIKHPMIKKAAQHYKKTPADIVKVLQQRISTKGDRNGETKEISIDFKDTDSGIVVKHKMKFN